MRATPPPPPYAGSPIQAYSKFFFLCFSHSIPANCATASPPPRLADRSQRGGSRSSTVDGPASCLNSAGGPQLTPRLTHQQQTWDEREHDGNEHDDDDDEHDDDDDDEHDDDDNDDDHDINDNNGEVDEAGDGDDDDEDRGGDGDGKRLD